MAIRSALNLGRAVKIDFTDFTNQTSAPIEAFQLVIDKIQEIENLFAIGAVAGNITDQEVVVDGGPSRLLHRFQVTTLAGPAIANYTVRYVESAATVGEFTVSLPLPAIV